MSCSMGISLLDIRSDAQRVAEAIAASLELEVTIIDRDYNLVASSRSFRKYYVSKKKKLYSSFWEEMFRTRKTLIVENPGEHPFCQGCTQEGVCPEKALVLTPIWFGDYVVGSIGITCFDEEQRKNVLRKNEILTDFLNRMSELLTVKISEMMIQRKLNLTIRQLETTMDYAKEGLICVDKNGQITNINSVATSLLKLQDENTINRPIEEVIPGFPLKTIMEEKKIYEEQEIILSRDKKIINLLISAKPLLIDNTVQSVVISIRDMSEVHALINKMTGFHHNYSFDKILGQSKEVEAAKQRAKSAARGDSTVLIQGETGTGKELFARAIHNYSQRSNGPFIPINCGAIPEALLESELFGYEEGAFTGARKGGKPGKFEMAKGGTVFLDEIGDMPLHLQVKLLRVIQEKEIQRLGGTRIVPVDVRIIAATHKDLEKMVEKGEFREDLFYRINVIPLFIPPLRDRTGDILLLTDYFIKKYNGILNKSIKGVTEEALMILSSYMWPGNVRELENCVEYAINMEEQDRICKINLPERILRNTYLPDINSNDKELPELEKKMKFIEEVEIVKVLKKYNGLPRAKEKAAKELGISRATLYRKIKKIRERSDRT